MGTRLSITTKVVGSILRKKWSIPVLIVIVASILNTEWTGVLHTGAGSSLQSFGSALIDPDLSSSTLSTVIRACWITVSYAATSLSLAVLFGIPLGLLASGTILPSSPMNTSLAIGVRAVLGLTRSVHELIWALLFVAALGLSPTAGVLAIAIPYSGIIGRVLAERIQDVPEQRLLALQSNGATALQQTLLARIPSVMPDMTSYLFYRFECAIRTAAVLSFVGLGGIGFRIQLAMNDLRFETVASFLYALVILILAVDVVSGSIRKRMIT